MNNRGGFDISFRIGQWLRNQKDLKKKLMQNSEYEKQIRYDWKKFARSMIERPFGADTLDDEVDVADR